MTEEVIQNLHTELKKWVRTLRKCSETSDRQTVMVDSDIKAVRFDKVSNAYGKLLHSNPPKTNDALYISETGKWYFVEFKSGSIDRADIYRKMYDSVNALIELKIISGLAESRTNIEYILVYNEGKLTKGQKQKMISDHLHKLADKEQRLFDIDKFDRYLFADTHTYTTKQFEGKMLSWWK